MRNKYFNDAIIGNCSMTASFSNKGELLRLFYPSVDYMQHIDSFKVGVTSNDSNTVWLEDDINNLYHQEFEPNTNILNTNIFNKYFKINVLQRDYVSINKDVLVKKYTIKNENDYYQNINFIIYSKLLKDSNNYTSGYFFNDTLVQYNHDCYFSVFSDKNVSSYQINGSESTINSGEINGKDYIGMSNDSSIMYNLGVLKPNESKDITIYITIKDNLKSLTRDITIIKNKDEMEEYLNVKRYWENYVDKHKNIRVSDKKADEIYTRSILTFPLLINKNTGGISAAIEVDENMTKCGRYSYCWPRDSIFINSALAICNMNEEIEMFYNNFSKNTQLENGMWEQRYYTDCNLAPCWGYQIDETASIICGIWSYYTKNKKIEFLFDNMDMMERAIKYLERYLYNLYSMQLSYNLWEETEGIHLYSMCAICKAFESMAKVYIELDNFNVSRSSNNKSKIENLDELNKKTRKIIEEKFYNGKYFVRNNLDDKADVSTLGLCIPFEILNVDDERVVKTVELLENRLKTPFGGMLRYENDNYMNGNQWVLASLWMSLYYIELGEITKAKQYFKWVCDTACQHGYLAEQIDKNTNKPAWIIGLRMVSCNVYISIG